MPALYFRPATFSRTIWLESLVMNERSRRAMVGLFPLYCCGFTVKPMTTELVTCEVDALTVGTTCLELALATRKKRSN